MILPRHLTGILLLLAALSAIAAAEKPAPPAALSPQEVARQGRDLVASILSQRPAENMTNRGVMIIADSKNQQTRIPIEFSVFLTPTNWISTYSTAVPGKNHYASFAVLHANGEPNRYLVPNINRPPTDKNEVYEIKPGDLFMPFAGSDFWLVDLSLDFLQWPDQRLVKKEMRRSRSCNVLESINPKPQPGAYSRVVSWLDIESTNGIIYAEAFDFGGRKIKEFIPARLVQRQLQKMEIDNDQTDSRTTVLFDIDRNK
jgi:hypothetical protein